MSIERLLEGYRRFRKTRFAATQELYRKLGKQGQSPEVLFIACCDSRVDPATIFDTGPGELFVVRNVANLVPPWAPDGSHHGTSAAIEFAVRHLKVRDIVVMGHAQCGGVAALLKGFHEQPGASDFIGSWISLAEEAKQRMVARQDSHSDQQRELEYEIVVVDDGSTDNTANIVREADRCSHHKVVYIREPGRGVAFPSSSPVCPRTCPFD